jgi:bifunctional DNA-binding transcriptional regulator/antitoxin component of YhaV-PrlF toxin-antitoxin module
MSTNGTTNVPAPVKERENLGYNDEVEMTIQTPQGPTDAVVITRFINSDGNVTIPSEIRNMLGFAEGMKYEIEWEATGNHFEADVHSSPGRADYTGDSDEITDGRCSTVERDDGSTEEFNFSDTESVTDILE